MKVWEFPCSKYSFALSWYKSLSYSRDRIEAKYLEVNKLGESLISPMGHIMESFIGHSKEFGFDLIGDYQRTLDR